MSDGPSEPEWPGDWPAEPGDQRGLPSYGEPSPNEPTSIPPPPDAHASIPPPPGAPQRKRSWKWIVVVFLVAPIALIAGCIVLFVGAVRGPIDAANEFMRDVQDGDANAAIAHLDPACFNSVDTREVLTLVSNGLESWNLTGTSNNNNTTGEARGTITFDSGERNITFEMTRPGQEWLVCGVRIPG